MSDDLIESEDADFGNSSEGPVFKAEFTCRNCMTEFTKTFAKGVDLVKGSSATGMTHHQGWVAKISYSTEHRIWCPVCDSKNTAVDEREPLVGKLR